MTQSEASPVPCLKEPAQLIMGFETVDGVFLEHGFMGDLRVSKRGKA